MKITRFQFSVRTLLLWTTICALGISAVMLYRGPSRNERLRRAVLADDQIAVDWWLLIGADPDAGQGTYGWNPSPLQIAVIREYLPIVESLIDAGAYLDYRDQRAKTAMLHAAQAGNWDMVRLLYQAGAEHRYVGNNGKSVLDYATLVEQMETIDTLNSRPTPRSCWQVHVSDERFTHRFGVGSRSNREFKVYYIPAQYEGLSDGWVVKQFHALRGRSADGEIVTLEGPESIEIDENGNALNVTYSDGSTETIPI